MRQATQSPEVLLQYLVQQLGPQKAVESFAALMQQNPGAYDPNDIPTYQEADKLIETRIAEAHKRIQELEQSLEQRFEKRLQEENSRIQNARQQQEYATQFDSMIKKSFEDHPELDAIDHIEDVLRFKLATKIENYYKINGQEPPMQQAAQWWNDVVKEQVTKLNTKFAVQKANSPLNNSIEPAGGQRPVNVNTGPKSYYNKKTGEVDSDTQIKDLISQIQGLNRL